MEFVEQTYYKQIYKGRKTCSFEFSNNRTLSPSQNMKLF